MVGDHQRAPWLQVAIGTLQRLAIVIALFRHHESLNPYTFTKLKW